MTRPLPLALAHGRLRKAHEAGRRAKIIRARQAREAERAKKKERAA